MLEWTATSSAHRSRLVLVVLLLLPWQTVLASSSTTAAATSGTPNHPSSLTSTYQHPEVTRGDTGTSTITSQTVTARAWRCHAECVVRHSAAPPANCRPLVEVHCSDLGLRHLPTCTDGNLTVIHSFSVSGNNLTLLGPDALRSMDSLQTLILSDNAIVSLDRDAFRHVRRTLVSLGLDSNLLEEVPYSSLQLLGDQRLANLNLSRNRITNLEVGALSALNTLEVLDLSANAIGNLSRDSFRGLRRLVRLDLSHNLIISISEGTFRSLVSLQKLSLGDNAIRVLEPNAFQDLVGLVSLELDHNRMETLPTGFTSATPALAQLDLSFNPIKTLQRSQLSPGLLLETVNLSRLPALTEVLPDAFVSLPRLRTVDLSHCPHLWNVDPNAFRQCDSLEELDLSFGGLKTLHGGLVNTTVSLKQLNLRGNRWRCDCALFWMTLAANRRLFPPGEDLWCSEPSHKMVLDGGGVIWGECVGARVLWHTDKASFKLGSRVTLECRVTGHPAPTVTWYTPHNHVLHWYPRGSSVSPDPLATTSHWHHHDTSGVAVTEQRITVEGNGTLWIASMEIADAGTYLCLTENSLGNQSVLVSVGLDYEIMQHVKVVSIMVGLATSVAFLIAMLIAQLAQMMLNRWGWCCCCCKGQLPPRAKKIRKMLESVEHYKTQQLERLRENYNLQVQRIKDNGTQQLERLRDSYGAQAERLRDIRDYGNLQIDRMRDQYYEQVRRVRDYSFQQMNRVRENYVFQRNRIRKFSAHQLFKLRENYKVQQLHLNKILENLNLESCRTVCARTDSVNFTSEIMGAVDTPDFGIPLSARLDDMDDFDLRDVMLPAGLEEFEMQPLDVPPSSLPDGDAPVLFIDDDDGVQGAILEVVSWSPKDHVPPTTTEVRLEDVRTTVVIQDTREDALDGAIACAAGGVRGTVVQV